MASSYQNWYKKLENKDNNQKSFNQNIKTKSKHLKSEKQPSNSYKSNTSKNVGKMEKNH